MEASNQILTSAVIFFFLVIQTFCSHQESIADEKVLAVYGTRLRDANAGDWGGKKYVAIIFVYSNLWVA